VAFLSPPMKNEKPNDCGTNLSGAEFCQILF